MSKRLKRLLSCIPDPSAYSPKRLFCLDLLRGVDMFYLAVGGVLLEPILKLTGASTPVCRMLTWHPWYGFTFWDMIMPLFIFMSGAAVPFALGKRLDADGRPAKGYWKHVWSRFALLWFLGMIAQGGLTHLDIKEFIPYSNTLQTIAVGYVVAAWLYPMRKWVFKVALPIALLVVYGLLIHFGGDYTADGNLAQVVDLRVWNWMLPPDNTQIGFIHQYHYAWLLPSMMFPVLALGGCYSTQILLRKDPAWTRAGWLALFGGISLAAGWVLYFCGIEMVKHIFTVSFTLQAVGWAVLALDALFVLTDIWKLRRGTGLILLFGQFALVAYLMESVFREPAFALVRRFVHGVPHLFGCVKGGSGEALIEGIGFSVLTVIVLVVYRRLKNKGEK